MHGGYNSVVADEEIVKILLSAALSLSSITVVIIGVLLSQYVALKHKPESDYVLQPYRKLLWIMLGALILGAVTTFASLFFLLNIDMYYAIIVLFMLLVALIVLGVFYTVLKILGGSMTDERCGNKRCH